MRRLFMLALASLPLVIQAEVKLFLQDGSFSNGVVRTEQGGVIEDDKIRIQAKHLVYERTAEREIVTAYGDLLVLYDKRLLTGKKLTYNFATREGLIEDPVLGSEGWVVCGETLQFKSDGSVIIEKGYVAPPSNFDASIGFERLRLQRSSQIQARRLSIRLFKKELLCLNQIRTTLDSLTDLPFQVRFSIGGYQSARASLRYRLIKTDEFKAYLRLDAILTRGLGGGLDTNYRSTNRRTSFDSKTFLIRDRSWDDPDVRLRYRLQGVAEDRRGLLHIRASYDWLSDVEMASNYSGKDFELPTAQRTELFATYKETNWLADFTTRVRINSFQTINQQLPGFQISWRPFTLGPTGIVSDNRIKAAYLSYVYADGTPNTSDFSSARIELRNRNYRHFKLGYMLFTPEAGFNVIHYSNGPVKQAQEQAVVTAGASLSAPFFSNNALCVHTFEPYSKYLFSSRPTAPFGNTYIFSIDDGYGQLSMLKAGLKQSFFLKRGPSCFIRKPLFFDLWAIGFFDAPTLQNRIPRIYGAFSWSPFATLETKIEAAWNRDLHSKDYANISAFWTVNEDLAIKIAFLSRGPRAWRKADPDNFMIDMIQSEESLQNSLLSDHRNTFLSHIFWRFHPDWTAEFATHTGWNRPSTPAYNEYKIGFSTILYSYWRLGFGYERREIEDRFSFNLKLIR